MRPVLVAAVALVTWSIAFATWRVQPAGYDFIAYWAPAHLIAIGQGRSATDLDAVFVTEREALPERTLPIGHANPPALSLLMAPIGALPITYAYAVWIALGVLALLGAAYLLGPLAPAKQRPRLFPFAMLASTSLVALVEGQTTPFVLLAVAASLRAPPFWSGVLLGATALRPQVFPLFGLAALSGRSRAAGMAVTLAALVVLSFAGVGVDGMARYPALLVRATNELRPTELGIGPLVRRIAGAEDVVLYLALALALFAVGAYVVLRRASTFESRLVDAATWSLLIAPHALLHDAVLAYPGVAGAAATTARYALWVGAGLAVALIQQAGIPLASFYLLALYAFGRRRPTASPRPDVGYA